MLSAQLMPPLAWMRETQMAVCLLTIMLLHQSVTHQRILVTEWWETDRKFESLTCQCIVHRTMEKESRMELKSWYARVPTHSNISDGPSRLDCTEVEQLGSTEMKADWDLLLESLL